MSSMRELLVFLGSAVLISLSGVMAPGALTAATLAVATRNRWAGTLVAVGHAVVELPLIVLIVLGMDELLKRQPVQIGIGLAGGAFLLLMAWGMFRSLRRPAPEEATAVSARRSPIVIGIVLSASNPYFLLWWATVGLALATQAVSLGIMAFALFAVIHWLLDLIWLTLLSWVTYGGGKLMGDRTQRVILAICAAALVFFGGKFLFDAGHSLLKATN